MIELPGGIRLGAHEAGGGTRFALYSSVAERIHLCLLDEQGNETGRHSLEDAGRHVWTTFVPGCSEGQLYGYRVTGPYQPDAGLRCNPHKLLIDPYARLLRGELSWDPAVLGYSDDDPQNGAPSTADSAPFVPKSVVTGPDAQAGSGRPDIAWRDSVIYELNVRGYTMRCKELDESERGRFAGLSNGQILDYLKSLGITAVELMPAHAFIDEFFLHQRGLRNYWGYNTLGYFAPAGRYAGADPIGEFRAMVNAIHDAGLEVILDVVYNHSAETDEFGPTLSFRGIDNAGYYRLPPHARHEYVNDTGCGNMLDPDQPAVQSLIIDSLVYWHRNMGVDGFRFDLATVLGRHPQGFDAAHPLLCAIEHHPELAAAKLIAEPWDVGPGGYRLGGFGPCWGEWNDRYRDSVRRFWRGDEGETGEFARRVHGSAELFGGRRCGPAAGISFVTSHDGFTLADVMSYTERHNEANGQNNADGHAHNFSSNHGCEGPTEDPAINALRRRQRLNMLATLLVSSGTPMLLAGDEFGHSQQGNNNAYAQDNETTWLDWDALTLDPDFTEQVGEWVRLRQREPLLRPTKYLHGETGPDGLPNILWLHPEGRAMDEHDWASAQAFGKLLGSADDAVTRILAVLFNASPEPVEFLLPDFAWEPVLATGEITARGRATTLQDHSIAVLRSPA